MSSWFQRRPHVFGPIVLYDLIRSGRRRRFLAVRFVYGLFLLLTLLLAYGQWYVDQGSVTPQPSQLAAFSATFFVVFMATQYLCVLALTPAYTAGAIAEEKERQTLDALLASELSTREIVFGFYFARMAKLGMVLLTGLPILGFLQFMGGIDPGLMLAGFAACVMTLIGLAALSLWQSVVSRKPREAIVRTYFIMLAYLALSGISQLLLLPVLGVATYPSTDSWSSPVTVEDVVEVLSSGNFLILVGKLVHDLFTGADLSGLIPALLTRYAWFHGLLAVFCCAWVMLRLRVTAQPSESASVSTGRKSTATRAARLLGVQPVLWKELIVDAMPKRAWYGRLATGAGIAAILWPGVHCCACLGRFVPAGQVDYLAELLNLWIRCTFALIGSLMLLQVAFRASGSICGERDRQTLDGLLATPLSNRAILGAKWLGSVTAPRYTALLIAGLGGFGVWTQTLHPLAFLAWIASWFIFAGFLAGLGLWFSVASKTSRHATFGTMVTCVLVLMICGLAAVNLSTRSFSEGEPGTLLPPILLATLPFRPQEVSLWWYDEVPYQMWTFPAMWLLWILISLVLWKLVQIRFEVVTGRQETGSPTGEDEQLNLGVPCGSWWPDWFRLWRNGLASLLVVLPTLLLMAGYYAVDRAAERNLQAAMAAVEASDGPWRIEDLEARRPMFPKEQDSAKLTTRLTPQIPGDWLSDPKYGRILDALEPEKQLRPEEFTFLQNELIQVKHIVAQAMKLKDMPRGRMPITYAVDPYTTNREIVQQTRRLGNLLQSVVLVQIQESKFNEALESIKALVHAGRAINDEPLIISQLVRLSLESMATPLVERCLAQGQPSPAALDSLQQIFEHNDRIELFLQAMRGERALMDQQFKVFQEGKGLGPRLFNNRSQKSHIGFPTLPRGDELHIWLTASLKQQRAWLLQALTEELAAAGLPAGQREMQMTAVQNKWIKQSWSVRFMLPAWDRLLDSFLRCQAEQECIRVSLAAERFRQVQGKWPSSIGELVPAYLPQIPLDPFDGLAIRVKRWQYGLVIYAVSQDRVDNGGNIDRKKSWMAGTDLGIRLWDPAYRRQAPPPQKLSLDPGGA